MRRSAAVRLQRGERAALRALISSPGARPRIVARARIVLRAADGASDARIAQELSASPSTVATWRRRFLAQRVPGLLREAPRSGRPPVLPPSRIREIVRMTLGRRPADGGRWTVRRMARETGLSRTTVQRIWRAHNIVPERAAETVRRNPGAKFVEHVTDLVGVYQHAPDRAIAFSVDERRRAPPPVGWVPRPLLRSEEERRAREFRAFLQAVDRETPAELDVHVLLDGRLASTTADVRRWLGHHPRFYLHYLGTEAASPNVLDRWWAGFASARARSGSSTGADRLRRAFRHHFDRPNASGRAFVWTAVRDEIHSGGAPRTETRKVSPRGAGPGSGGR